AERRSPTVLRAYPRVPPMLPTAGGGVNAPEFQAFRRSPDVGERAVGGNVVELRGDGGAGAARLHLAQQLRRYLAVWRRQPDRGHGVAVVDGVARGPDDVDELQLARLQDAELDDELRAQVVALPGAEVLHAGIAPLGLDLLPHLLEVIAVGGVPRVELHRIA